MVKEKLRSVCPTCKHNCVYKADVSAYYCSSCDLLFPRIQGESFCDTYGMRDQIDAGTAMYNEDCRDTMIEMNETGIRPHLVITSPPYNMNLRVRNGQYCSRLSKTRSTKPEEFSTKYEEFTDDLPIKKFLRLHSCILNRLLRISPLVFYNISIVTGSKRAFFQMIGDHSEELKDIIVWDKGHGIPSMRSDILNRRAELILVFSKDGAITRDFDCAQWDRGKLDDLWTIHRQRAPRFGHGATFPEAMVAKILENFSFKGDLVYDPFIGTGTTAVVAKRMNRKFIGSEISESYYKSSLERLADAV